MLSNHDQYYRYQELTDFLHLLQKTYPDLVHLESLGKSEAGREMWLATVTDFKSGAPDDKPAFWVDGNTHAGEVTGCQACCHLLDTLTSDFATKPEVRELLQKMTFYVLPRISVDGAELYLTTPDWTRSSTRWWPHPEPVEGFYSEDIDGDGQILTMRMQDPSGPFKVSKLNPKLLIPREPTDFASTDGPFYRLMGEGKYHHYDGFTQTSRSARGLDLNRQSPARFEPKEYGAGPAPAFLPEAQALANAFIARPNICGATTHHTFGGFLLRPSSFYADADLPTFDLEVYKMIGKIGEDLMGYKCYGIFHEFRYDPKEVTTGSWDDWHYHHRGIYSFTPEIWSLTAQVGWQPKNPVETYQRQPEDVYAKAYDWCDKNCAPGSFYQDWKPFQHPQLGAVEIGGWKTKFTWTNPPTTHLKTEIEKLTKFSMAHARLSPVVCFKKCEGQKATDPKSLHRLEIQIQNQGFLPTDISEAHRKLNNPLKPHVQLFLSPGLKLRDGRSWQELPHLTGRSVTLPYTTSLWGGHAGNSHETKVTWWLEGSGTADIEVNYYMGGKLRQKVSF